MEGVVNQAREIDRYLDSQIDRMKFQQNDEIDTMIDQSPKNEIERQID